MATREEKMARIKELVSEGNSYSDAIAQSDEELGEGYSSGISESSGKWRKASSGYTGEKVPEKYKKEYPVKHEKKEEKFIKPRLVETEEELEEYLGSLSPKERWEQESRLKGFQSGEERRRAIEYVNRKRVQKTDIEVAKERQGTPIEAFHRKFGGEEKEPQEEKYVKPFKPKNQWQKTVGKPLTEAEILKPFEKAGEKIKYAGKYVIGSAVLALERKKAGDIRSLPEIRKEIEAERQAEKIKEMEEKAFQLKLARAYSGAREYPQRPRKIGGFGGYSTTRRPKPTAERLAQSGNFGTPMDMRIGGAGGLNMNLGGGSGFSLGEAKSPVTTSKAKPSVKVVARPIQRDASDILGLREYGTPSGGRAPATKFGGVSSGDPFGLGGYYVPKTSQTSQVVRTPVHKESANSLVSMGGFGSGANPVGNFGVVKNPMGGKSVGNTPKGKKQKEFWET